MTTISHPQDILLGAQAAAPVLPVCDHFSGQPERMRKSLQLQAQMTAELGRCVFDVTLDCEDGATVGQEVAHANAVAALVREHAAAHPDARIAVRVHALDHPAFVDDVARIVGQVGDKLTHVMLPKAETVDQVDWVARALDRAYGPRLPLHVLIESPAAVQQAFAIAAHPRVQSISFGLMDFVSAHGGAIPASAMGVQPKPGLHPHVEHSPGANSAHCGRVCPGSRCRGHGRSDFAGGRKRPLGPHQP